MHILFQTKLVKIFLQGVFGFSKLPSSFSLFMYRSLPQAVFAFFLINIAPSVFCVYPTHSLLKCFAIIGRECLMMSYNRNIVILPPHILA
jgi:hypothetical protein